MMKLNVMPLVLNSLLMILLCVAAIIPLGLGLLIYIPITFYLPYVMYVTMFEGVDLAS